MRKQIYQPRKYRFIVRSIVTFTLLIGMLNLALPVRWGGPIRATAANAVAADLSLRSESQLRNEATLFQTAINEIGRISTMRISTNKELAVANAIVDKHLPNLKFARSKLIAMGLADSTFTAAVKRKGADKAANEQFGIDLAQDPTNIFKVSGGQALGDRMRSALAADTAKIKQVAAVLKKASEDLKAKQDHHASRTSSGVLAASAEPMNAAPVELSAVDIAVIVVVVAVIAFPLLALVLVNISTGVIVAAVAVGAVVRAAELIGNLVKNASTDEGRDEVAACEDAVDRKYRRCKNSAEDLGIFADAAKAACYADWLLAAAACWVS